MRALLQGDNMNYLQRTIASVVAVCVLGMSLPSFAQSPAGSGLIKTEETARLNVQDRLTQWLAREDVRNALVARGVDPGEVRDRVNALTDDEAQILAQRIDQLPVGGDAIGVILFIFVLLLITDILGLTKVFPFTRPIR
jgi:hypothetical protein